MAKSLFNGEYWNVDAKTSAITRFRFTQGDDDMYVSAWGSCFPEDCEWGDTPLHILKDEGRSSDTGQAFATWVSDAEPSHCLFELDHDELRVTLIAIRSEFSSYKRKMTFRKDAARSAEALNPDPLAKFKHMWDGSQPGWKLIQYPHPVYQVAFDFDESGPNRLEFQAVLEFVSPFPGESEDQMWERLRGCEGIGIGKLFGPTAMKRLRTLQAQNNLNLTVLTIEPDDYLVRTPGGGHFGWGC